jgi:hypothetical protein
MTKEQLFDAVKSLVERGTFAVLAVLTREGDVVLRPIGGRWGSGIRDAVQEMAEKYRGCKMRLFSQEIDYKHFGDIVSRDQVLPYADYSPETKAALEELRRQVLDPSRKEFWKEFWEEKGRTLEKSP